VQSPYAGRKGPVKRKRKTMMGQKGELVPTEEIRNEWERVDPFMLYWAPWSSDIQDGFIVERHRMTREDLQALIGVPGYNDDAIRSVLNSFEMGNLNEWLWTDSAQATAEGKDTTQTIFTTDLIDALQMWDSVQGKELLTWGLSAKEIPDPDLNYPCEVWLVGSTVIRAVLNYDPLGRKPYYVTSYERVPGAVAGKGVADLCRDSQNMVNAAARSLANNMGISSGPQVGVNVSRLPPGEDITEMYPWKIWQFQSSEFNDGSQPLTFFQPNSNANELMTVFEKFSARADEDTMIPRYMTGESSPGAGRTSSGLSMLMGAAGKGIRQVVMHIDTDVVKPIVMRQFVYNMRYDEDESIKGDVVVIAKGAINLAVKETVNVRRIEFLNATANPVDMEIMGVDGRASILREIAKGLQMSVDDVVPSREKSGYQNRIQAMAQAVAAQQAPAEQGTPTQPDGSPKGGQDGNTVSSRVSGMAA